jgi:hypothetical protein
LLLLLFSRISFIYQKEGLHLDEVLSVVLSQGGNYGCKVDYDENVVYTGKQLKQLTLYNKASMLDAIKDVKKLYINNNDRPHTNLFYSFFRLWFGGKTVESLKDIIEHGCRLNLLFFIFSFFFMYKLLRKLFADSGSDSGSKSDNDSGSGSGSSRGSHCLSNLHNMFFIPFSLLIAFGNTGSISNTLFLRPYQLQETLLILFTYSFVCFYELIENRCYIFTLKNLCKFVPVIGLTLLSGYFAAIYVLMLIGILVLLSWSTGQKESCKFIVIAFLLSILFARLLFCGFFYGFSCGRAGEAYKQFSYKVIVENFTVSYKAFCEILNNHLINIYFFGFIYAVAVFSLFMRKPLLLDKFKKPDIKFLLIFLSCLIWSFGNMFLAPFKILRYIMSCFPLIILIFPFAVSRVRNLYIKCGIAVLTMFCVSGFWNNSNTSAHVDYLFSEQKNQLKFLNQKEHTIILNKCIGKYNYIMHLLNDNQSYEFTHSGKNLEDRLNKYRSALVLFSNDFDDKEILNSISSKFTATLCGKYEEFSGYIVKAKKP